MSDLDEASPSPWLVLTLEANKILLNILKMVTLEDQG